MTEENTRMTIAVGHTGIMPAGDYLETIAPNGKRTLTTLGPRDNDTMRKFQQAALDAILLMTAFSEDREALTGVCAGLMQTLGQILGRCLASRHPALAGGGAVAVDPAEAEAAEAGPVEVAHDTH